MLESSHKDAKPCYEVIIYNHKVTVRSTRFWHPCQNDGVDCTVSKKEYFAWSD